jgi:hypothetical protein
MRAHRASHDLAGKVGTAGGPVMPARDVPARSARPAMGEGGLGNFGAGPGTRGAGRAQKHGSFREGG